MLNQNSHYSEKVDSPGNILSPENSIFSTDRDYLKQQYLESSNKVYNLDVSTDLAQIEAKVWQGIKLEQEDKLAEAIEHYRQAVELNSKSAVAHHILAIALKKQGNLTEADRYHRLALSLGQDNDLEQDQGDREQKSISLTRSNSSIVLPKITSIAPGTYVENNQLEVTKIYLQQAKLYYAERRWQESINACQEALKICPDLPETYKIYGNCLQQMGQIPEAMGYYAQAIAKDPHIAEVYANIGSLYAKESNWQEAITYYQKALAIDPKLAKVCLHLSRAWERIGEDERALNCLLHGLKLQPEILTVPQLMELGDDLFQEGKMELAITCYQSAIKIQPQSKELYLKLIKALEKDGQWQKVAVCYQKVVKLQENNSAQDSESKKLRIDNLLTGNSKTKCLSPSKSTSNAMGESSGAMIVKQEDKSDSDILVSQYLEELKKQPNSPTIRLNLGNLFARKEQWQQAIANYQQAIQLKPDLLVAYLRLAKVYGIIGKTLEGAELIYRAYSIQPEIATPEQHYKLGDFWLKHDRTIPAIGCYRRAVQLKPDFKAAYLKLQNSIELEKRRQQSIKVIDTKQAHSPPSDRTTEYISSESQKASSSALKQQSPADNQLREYQKYFDRAVAEEKAGNEEVACQLYQQAINCHPQNKEAYYRLGKLLSDLKQWHKIVEIYQKAIASNSPEFSYHHNLGNAYFELKEWQKAIASYEKSIALNQNFSWSYFKLGEAFMELKQWQAAADAMSNSIKLKSDFDWAHHKLGDVATHLEDWDTAVRAYQNALKITSDLPQTKEKLTDALRQRSQADMQQAEGFYNDAIKVNPNDESLYFKALEVKPNNPDHYVKLAQIYESKGKMNVALSFYKIALQINPQNVEVKAKLSSLQL
ncbi:tetratricopeptide repeat protein [Waterburya agarophytonicola K14]|uniref:Tetratricopeptide repeat protein n=1 Tax=Waterburya agarophytonicola KI4 TaxID=2874699 RepID=A0A964BNX3_9CYAN|nr:tetratricopeptide repeat protein [Waterburya agarophytonicola]MCC0176869.1 tetratricopeptide repeat protein [Waterburya agarophytonicola KI4]